MANASLVAASGMTSCQTSLGSHAENIANKDVDNFKKKIPVMIFAGGGYLRNKAFSPRGSLCNVIQNVQEQGILRPTENNLDLAIVGNGMFVYGNGTPKNGSIPSDSILFGRGGRHTPDQLGYLQHITGQYLMGWPVDEQGNILPSINTSSVDSLEPIRVSSGAGFAKGTEEINLQANIPVVDPNGNTYTTKIDCYDDLGRRYQVSFNWTRVAVGHLELTVTCPDAVSVKQDDGTGADFTTTPMTILMDGNGNPQSFDGALVPPKLFLETVGTNNISINLGLGTVGSNNGITSIGNKYNVPLAYQDGKPYGNFSAISIDPDGNVSAFFDNGLNLKIYKLAMASFKAPDQLALTGNFYTPTAESGTYTLESAGKSGLGTIESGVVESSTVDIAQEFIAVLSDQQGFSANTKIVKIDNDMMTELLSIIR